MRGIAGVVLVAALAPSAVADPTADVAYAEGQQLYTAGRYIDAAQKFESAYALNQDPAYLFNVAQSYRFGNSCEKAANAYRLFLPTVVGASARAKIQSHIDQMDVCAREQATIAEKPTPPPVLVAEKLASPIEKPTPPPVHHTPWLAITSIGIGVAGVAVGVVGEVKLRSIADDREGLCDHCVWADVEKKATQLDDRGKRWQAVSLTGFVVGGVGIGGGIALWLLSGRSAEQPPVALIPTSGGAMAVGAFHF
ncbi:MAG TPA: hypothetical protein VGM90_03900 [Kofleriaceae bacterium]